MSAQGHECGSRALARRTLGNGSISAARIGRHLKSLCEEDRGEILQQIGTDRKFRYRFVEPMMQPFILIQGLRTGQITSRSTTSLLLTISRGFPTTFSGPLSDGHAAVLSGWPPAPCPPLAPPSCPHHTAAGSLPCQASPPSAMSIIDLASWLGSLGRLGVIAMA
jgi:hypothetical protein